MLEGAPGARIGVAQTLVGGLNAVEHLVEALAAVRRPRALLEALRQPRCGRGEIADRLRRGTLGAGPDGRLCHPSRLDHSVLGARHRGTDLAAESGELVVHALELAASFAQHPVDLGPQCGGVGLELPAEQLTVTLGGLVQLAIELEREVRGGALQPVDLTLDPILGEQADALHELLGVSAEIAVEAIGLRRELLLQVSTRSFGGLLEPLEATGALARVAHPRISISLACQDVRIRTWNTFHEVQDGSAAAPVAEPRPAGGAASPIGSRITPAAAVALVVLGGVFTWWALEEGGYFESVLLPSTAVLCIGAGLLIAFAPWRLDLRHSRPAAAALLALTALGVWSVLSAGWSPAPEIAIGDGQRTLVYALCFGLGLGLCNLLAQRMHLALGPVALAAGVAAVVTAARLATGSVPVELLEIDGTLDFPIGYRNANSAFFAIAFFAALGLAAERRLHPLGRVAALVTATGCADLFLLSQSRASIPAIAVAIVVFVLLSPLRLRSVGWLALAALPAIGVVPAAADLYSAVNEGDLIDGVAEMNAAGIAVAATMAASALIAVIVVAYELRLPAARRSVAGSNRGVALALAGLAATGAVAFMVAVGDPVDWVDERLAEFRQAETPDLSDRSSRFTINVGSGRYDLWRVALDDFRAEPLLGDGGGGFQYSYLRQRERVQRDPRDAHSVELEVLSELGLPGLALLVVGLGGAGLATRRSRRLGPAAASLGAVALASGAYWLVHSSFDWFWAFPAVTATTMGLLGAACAPAALATRRPLRRRTRLPLLVALAVLALSTVPPYLANRYVRQASEGWRDDVERAYQDLEAARKLNRFTDWPILIEGEIARESGDTARAIDAFSRAVEKRPEEWAGRYRLAQLLASDQPSVARAHIREALRLNPLGPEVRQLAERLGLDPVAETGIDP